MQTNILEAIDLERAYQDSIYHGNPHTVGDWILLLQGRTADAAGAWCGSMNDRAALVELLKVAALAVACIEQHGVYLRPELAQAATASPGLDRQM